MRPGLLLAALLPALAGAGADTGLTLLLRPEERELEIGCQGRRLLAYTFATNQFKPYVRELYTLDGINLLRDAPADHLHHHALMLAIKVNGLNFWEETPASGRQRPQPEFNRGVRRDASGRSHAGFSHVIHWVAAEHAATPDTGPVALLIEKRSLELSLNPQTEEVALAWQSEFEVGPGAARVALGGNPYHGLGIRFPAGFDDGAAARTNPAGLPYAAEGRDQVMEVPWTATSHLAGGRHYTLALFHHPANPGRLRMFSMVNPFAYLSATHGLDEAPLEYAAGERFTLRYLILVRPGPAVVEAMDQRRRQWLQP